MLRSLMVSCSVAQAKLFVKAGVYVMPARHGQEGAPQVGYKHWMHDPEAIELPRAQAAQHPEAPVENGGGRAGQVEITGAKVGGSSGKGGLYRTDSRRCGKVGGRFRGMMQTIGTRAYLRSRSLPLCEGRVRWRKALAESSRTPPLHALNVLGPPQCRPPRHPPCARDRKHSTKFTTA